MSLKWGLNKLNKLFIEIEQAGPRSRTHANSEGQQGFYLFLIFLSAAHVFQVGVVRQLWRVADPGRQVNAGGEESSRFWNKKSKNKTKEIHFKYMSVNIFPIKRLSY